MVASDQGDFCLLSHPGCPGITCPKAEEVLQLGSWSLGCVPMSLNKRAELFASLPVLGRAESLLLPVGNLTEKRSEVQRGPFPCPTSVVGGFPLARRHFQPKPFLPQTAVSSFSASHNTIKHCPPRSTEKKEGT